MQTLTTQQPQPRVRLVLPYHDKIEAGTAESFYRWPTAGKCLVDPDREKGSALEHVFNRLLVRALNDRKRLGLTHLAMHHGDIEAQPHYLDIMLAEMERTGCDFLSCTVPIKDFRALTSTGVVLDGNRIRRFTLTELNTMPWSFDAKGAGFADRVLLVNSALWVCRFTEDWAERLSFRMESSIVRGTDGRFEALFAPEDWNLSRDLHAMGLSVMATRRVTLNHWGQHGFPNQGTWGTWQTDEVGSE